MSESKCPACGGTIVSVGAIGHDRNGVEAEVDWDECQKCGKPYEPAKCYLEWRERADVRLADMTRHYWEHRHAAEKLDEEIHNLQRVMGNGASGGTAWTLHN